MAETNRALQSFPLHTSCVNLWNKVSRLSNLRSARSCSSATSVSSSASNLGPKTPPVEKQTSATKWRSAHPCPVSNFSPALIIPKRPLIYCTSPFLFIVPLPISQEPSPHRKMRLSTATAVLGILSTALHVRADYPPYDYSTQFAQPGASPGNASINYSAPVPHKYTYWYGTWAPELVRISESVCNLSLSAYRGDPSARDELGPVRNYCWTHSNCILQTATSDITQSIASASILLGLTPTILSVLGPSVAEIALLSLHRPLLSLLLSVGAPAVYPGRFLIWEDPLRANEPQTGAWVVRPMSTKVAVLVSVAQYVLALGAIAIIVHNAWTMGIRAVIVWACDSSYWPLLWVFLSIVIHIMGTLALRVAIKRKREDPVVGSPEPNARRGGVVGMVWHFLRSEFTPTANSKTQVRDHYDVRLGPLAVILQYTGALAALVHLIFGTAMFSSLLYIGNADAIPLILRFVSAAVVCRVVLQFEIGGMIRLGKERVAWRGIVQPIVHQEAEGEAEGEVDPKHMAEVAYRMTRQ